MAHIAVERNRRKLMNEHLKVLRSLTPCFYVKRGDQASIVGGVVEFIKELHQILDSLESKKRRKSLSLSPSPRTPTPRTTLLHELSSTTPPPPPTLPSPDNPNNNFGFESNTNNNSNVQELGACCNSSVADVEAKLISGSKVILRTISKRIPGQIVKLIETLEKLSFEILHLNISSMEDTVLYSFVIKIGLECNLSMEELAVEVQHAFF